MSSEGFGVHFFKVILESTLQKGELKVPTSFTRRHWQGMSNPVSLSLPNGTKLKVNWLKRDGDVWFCDGWKNFAKHTRLDVSHFVVFRYEGNSCFNVIIFGKSALEIEYPLSEGANKDVVEEIDDSDFSVKFVEEHSSLEAKRPKSPSPSSRTSKKVKISSKEEALEEEDEPKYWKKKDSFGNSNSKHMNDGSSGGELKKRIKTFHEKVKKMFHSENEHFTCAIQKTYIERDLLILPMYFSKTYLHKEEATLFVDEGRTWNVESRINNYGQLTFSIGWRKFSLDNKLKIGDVCAFELHKWKGFAFKVTIYSLEEDSSTSFLKGKEELFHRPSSSLKTPMAPEASTSKPKKDDDLCICIRPPFSLPTIPFNFIKRFVNENGRHVTLSIGNRSWLVKLLYYAQSSFARLSSGWAEFLKDCDLKDGDTCVLKMMDAKNLVFEVSFLKAKS